MSKISIIVPVYKVEKYLHRCIDSILAQTHTNLELILVDDGSPDRCGEICEAYARRDNRIKVIHKENGGLSDARNAGLDWMYANSDAEYISFVDSDDYIHPQMYEKMLQVTERENSDIVACTYSSVFIDEDQKFAQYAPVDTTTVESCVALERFYEQYYEFIWVSVCTKIYRRSIFETLRFRKGIIFEDQDVFPYIIDAAKRITVLPYPFYYYSITPNSLSRSGFSEKYIDTIEMQGRHTEFFVRKGLQSQADRAAVMYIGAVILTYQGVRDEIPQRLPLFWEQIRKHYPSRRKLIRENCNLSRMQRLILDIFPRLPCVAVAIYRFINR